MIHLYAAVHKTMSALPVSPFSVNGIGPVPIMPFLSEKGFPQPPWNS
jgi:hypothetical protein